MSQKTTGSAVTGRDTLPLVVDECGDDDESVESGQLSTQGLGETDPREST